MTLRSNLNRMQDNTFCSQNLKVKRLAFEEKKKEQKILNENK